MKWVLWLFGVPAALFGCLFLFFFIKEVRDDRTPWQKIVDACETEFRGRGEYLINDCKIRLGMKTMAKREVEALARAERLAR